MDIENSFYGSIKLSSQISLSILFSFHFSNAFERRLLISVVQDPSNAAPAPNNAPDSVEYFSYDKNKIPIANKVIANTMLAFLITKLIQSILMASCTKLSVHHHVSPVALF